MYVYGVVFIVYWRLKDAYLWLKVIINKILRENIPNGYLNNLLNIDIHIYIHKYESQIAFK